MLSGPGRVTGAESDGRLRSVTTSELPNSPAGDTAVDAVVDAVVDTVVDTIVDTVLDTVAWEDGRTVVDGLERSRKMLSLSVSKLSLELGGISVLMSVPVMLTVVAGVRVAGSGLGLLVVGLVVV